MTNIEKIKAEVSSILEEFKQKFTVSQNDKEINKSQPVISDTALYRTPSDIKSDMIYEMHESMNRYIEIFGDDNKPEIISHIDNCGRLFLEFMKTTHCSK